MPISARNAIRLAKPPTKPDSAEHTEKPSTAAINSGLRVPRASDHAPVAAPDSAHVSASADDTMPSCALVKCSSAAMNGNRNDSARRSKKTKPNVMNRISSNLFSYVHAGRGKDRNSMAGLDARQRNSFSTACAPSPTFS